MKTIATEDENWSMNGKFNTAFAITHSNLENDSKASKQNNTHIHTHTKTGHEWCCFFILQKERILKYVMMQWNIFD